jgi:NADPH:quinone reductase-like Zn-dependent oxidoreductase
MWGTIGLLPSFQRGKLLIGTTRTLVSAGTERMLIEFGKAGWIDKARQQPDKVRMVLDKIKHRRPDADGRCRVQQARPAAAAGLLQRGRVLEVGAGVTAFAVGDRVISNGKHAEAVSVPVNLCARVPDSVSDDEAAFTVVCAIGLQGIRLAQPTLGEAVVVTGLG